MTEFMVDPDVLGLGGGWLSLRGSRYSVVDEEASQVNFQVDFNVRNCKHYH